MSLRPSLSRPSVVFALAWLGLQIAIPAALLLVGERPAPFGWQMYSATRTPPQVLIEDRGGLLSVADFFALVPHPRADIDYASLLPPLLCRRLPDAAAVHVGREGAAAKERHPCP